LAEKIEALKKKRGEYAANLTALEKSGERQISLTDPDSRAMAAYTKVGVGYNVQIAVDAKEQDDCRTSRDERCARHGPSLLARFWTSRRSMSWPTKAISKARTSRLARRRD
jgi:hypothetical protein